MAETPGNLDSQVKRSPTDMTIEVDNSSATETEVDRHTFEQQLSPKNFRHPFSREHTKLDMDDYFIGPRDVMKYSKWPTFLRLYGSVLPEMVVPLLVVAGWSTLITCISKFVYSLSVSSLLLTVLGFVVGLGLSFRSSTAYERYGEGRRYWAQLTLASHNLGRVFWLHAAERPGEHCKEDLLLKLTGLNLVVAFAVALKHKLRFEPYTHYQDLAGLVGHLDTFAKAATTPEVHSQKKISFLRAAGQYLGLTFAQSNPRKAIKKSQKPLGNLPLEILSHMAAFVDEMVDKNMLKISQHQVMAYNNLMTLNDVLTGTERILNTPLPLAYTIAIAQMTWVYVMMLPFQLYNALGWVTIPATITGSYIILSILFIGREIENPFGDDVNDLPLDDFCMQIANEIDTIAAIRKPDVKAFMKSDENKVLFPVSESGYHVWERRSEGRIREELKGKVHLGVRARQKSLYVETLPNPQGEEKV